MAFFFGDGFDLYAAPGDALLGYWDANSALSGSGLAPGRFVGSRSWGLSFSTRLLKTSNINDGVHHFNFAWMQPSNITVGGTSDMFHITLFDGATQQCSVQLRNDGALLLTAGAASNNPIANILATFPNAVTAANVWYSFEVEVVIHNTNGSFAVRKNGNPTNDFFLGSLNTRATANNYANKIEAGEIQNVGSVYFDDFLWRSDASSVPWAGDIRCYSRFPSGDVSVSFTKTTNANSVTHIDQSSFGINQAFSGNVAMYLPFQAAYSGQLTSVSFQGGGGGTAHVKAALFAYPGGTQVGALLATSTELTNPGSGPITLTFPTPYRVLTGQFYWIGFNQDATVTYRAGGPGVGFVVQSPSSYASWPTSNPPGSYVTGGMNAPGLILTYTPQYNADDVSEQYQDGLNSYVSSSTAGTSAVTWNPSDLAATTLSNGNLTATATAAQSGVRATSGYSTGKYYFEITASTWNNGAVGVCLSTVALGSLWNAPSGAAILAHNGSIYINGGAFGAGLGTQASGNTVGIAIDLGGNQIWFRICPSGNWNGSGTANPATGAGGGTVTSGTQFPTFTGGGSGGGDVTTINFGASAFVGAVPSGFSTLSAVTGGDLYSIGGSVAPATIIGVTTRGLFEKSDAGTRNATVQLKSGSATVQGTSTALNTTWGWIWRTDLVDPATGTTWSASAVNNVNIGPVVTA